MKITVLKYGESTFEEKYIFMGGRDNVKLPISFTFYLIEIGNKKILVDVGCDDGAGFEMSLFEKPVTVLEHYGLRTSDITDVIITHAHHDHIASVDRYKNATIHIQENEFEVGKNYIPTSFKTHIFKDEFSLCDGVVIQKIGGHTLGSCIVVCKTGNKNYVLCGDECYIKACFERQIPTGNSCNPKASKLFLQDYFGANNIPLLFHDPAILKGKIGYDVILGE